MEWECAEYSLRKHYIFSFIKGELTKLLKKTQKETSIFKSAIFAYIVL